MQMHHIPANAEIRYVTEYHEYSFKPGSRCPWETCTTTRGPIRVLARLIGFKKA